jgi:phenylpropionate dioxygenase-like ring-hydroxylating dioxygenase large terminal subunit
MTGNATATHDTARKHLTTVARDLLAHEAAGTVPVADEIIELPAARYTDPDYFAREVQQVFRRVPVIVAMTAELRNPGDHTNIDIAGMPVLVMRGRDGQARTFLNACTHRGAIIANQPGSSLRLKCPYHGWNFDEQGSLVGVPCRKEFGDLDTENLGLKQFPTHERAGFIWAVLDPNSTLDIENFLGDFAPMLDQFGLADWHMFGRQQYVGANWKLAFDAHLDFYHLPVLHKNTFGPDTSPQAFYYHWGPHQRLARPGQPGVPTPAGQPNLFHERDLPEDQWSTEGMLLGEWIVYPNVSINGFYKGGRGVLVSQILPGDTVDESITVQTYLTREVPTGADRDEVAQLFDFLGRVVSTEDLPTSHAQQKALSTGILNSIRFGRNEGGLQQFHRWTNTLLDTPDGELNGLFRDGIDA